jgi:undecaprenyl-diphosphatase
LNFLQALLLGIVQGITEFFPVSSSAHLRFVRGLMGLGEGEQWLYFDLACHLGTWVALVFFLRREIWGVLTSIKAIGLFTLALVPLVPAYFLLKPLRVYLSAPAYTGYFLMVTAILLFLASRVQKKDRIDMIGQDVHDAGRPCNPEMGNPAYPTPSFLGSSRASRADPVFLSSVAPVQQSKPSPKIPAVICIGIAQAMALLPGLSRSGSTIATGRLWGWTWVEAARFSFLLAVPTIFGGEVLESWKLLGGETQVDFIPCVVGFGSALGVGLLSVRCVFWLYERAYVKPFAWYCFGFGLVWILNG